MPELKTKKTNVKVSSFLNSIEDKKKREDSKKLLEVFTEATKEKPAIWGDSIIGFGVYHYKSKRSSQEGDWFLCGFSPRKQAISLYIMSGFDKFENILKDLGKYKKSSGCCIYVNKLEDIKLPALKKLIRESCKEVKKTYSQ